MPSRTTLTQRVRSASAKRRAEHKTSTRDVVFRAAAELLDEGGYEGFSLRRLAERIGYTPTTIYRYFRDKDELVIAILLEGFAAFAQALRAAAAETPDPAAQIEALGRAYVRFGLDHPVMYRVLFMQRSDVWSRIPPEQLERECGESAFELLVTAVDRAMSTGAIRARDVQGTALSLWALMHGVVSLCLAMPDLGDEATREAMISSAFSLAEAGLES